MKDGSAVCGGGSVTTIEQQLEDGTKDQQTGGRMLRDKLTCGQNLNRNWKGDV